jgi:F0F1-type ATP synthase assembly protein I
MRTPGESLRDALRLSTVGITLALCIALGAGIGVWADAKLHTEPAFTVVGFLLGAAAGFRELMRAVNRR